MTPFVKNTLVLRSLFVLLLTTKLFSESILIYLLIPAEVVNRIVS